MFWGKDDDPMYNYDGSPANDAARMEGLPDWARRARRGVQAERKTLTGMLSRGPMPIHLIPTLWEHDDIVGTFSIARSPEDRFHACWTCRCEQDFHTVFEANEELVLTHEFGTYVDAEMWCQLVYEEVKGILEKSSAE